MKQSVDLMNSRTEKNSMKRYGFRHNNIGTSATAEGSQNTLLHRICNPMQQNGGFAIPTVCVPAAIGRRAMMLLSVMVMGLTGQDTSGYENRCCRTSRLFTRFSPSGFVCRLVVTLAILLAGGNVAWGVTWTDGSSAVDKGTFYVGEPTSPTYDFNVFDYVSLSEMLSAVNVTGE